MCGSGNAPLTDAADGDGSSATGTVAWHYADANERGYVDAILAWTAQLKAMGYDGVFIDAAGRVDARPVLADRVDLHVRPRHARGAIEQRVVRPAHADQGAGPQGLRDERRRADRARPDHPPEPGQPDGVQDRRAELLLDPARERRATRRRTTRARCRRPEGLRDPVRDPRGAGQERRRSSDAGMVVEMAKARLPARRTRTATGRRSTSGRSRSWRVDRWCSTRATTSAACPQARTTATAPGSTPALTDIRLGTPLDAAPYPAACNGASCMWVRRFQHGLVVVSAYGTPKRTATIPLGTADLPCASPRSRAIGRPGAPA